MADGAGEHTDLELVYSQVDLGKLGRFLPFINSDAKRDVFHGPERGDIIVLKDPRQPNTDLIKRVIGLPGETIEIDDSKVYINDQLLEEPYIKAPWHYQLNKELIPAGQYFVMGDNRENSQDSRAIGFIPRNLIIGKATFSYWPLSVFGLAPNASPKLTNERPHFTAERAPDSGSQPVDTAAATPVLSPS